MTTVDTSRVMVTPDGTLATIRSALSGNHETPSLRLAIWGAQLSPKMNLADNCALLAALRPYANGGLPDLATLRAVLDDTGVRGGMLEQKTPRLIAVDEAITAGACVGMDVMPRGLNAWLVWREAVAALPGLGWKTASMVGQSLWALDCPLVPVDSHHAMRLGHKTDYDAGKLSRDLELYHALEQRIEDDRRATSWARDWSLCAFAWHKWSYHRQATGAETPSVRGESHDGLSPYRY